MSFERTRVLESNYVAPHVAQVAANYAEQGSIPKYRWWVPFHLWEQMFFVDPHIRPWNILDPVIWRIVDIDKSQLPQIQAIYGKPLNFTTPSVAELKA